MMEQLGGEGACRVGLLTADLEHDPELATGEDGIRCTEGFGVQPAGAQRGLHVTFPLLQKACEHFQKLSGKVQCLQWLAHISPE